MKKLIFLIVASAALFLSCSKDDESSSRDNESSQDCRATNISMKVNGELKTFTTGGRGIDIIWGTGQYDLSLLFYGSTQGTLRLEMIYKETGNNVIDLLKLNNFDEAHTATYELVNDDFESNVLVNRSECFYATFSGKINANGEELIITEGVISYEYDEPFGE